MIDLVELDWDPKTLGEIDHQLVTPPYVRLNTYNIGEKGDIVYSYDLRVTQPNQEFLSTKILHSFEHLLLAGFRKYAGKDFVCVAPMGCQTGFYLVLLNIGDAETVIQYYENILQDILNSDAVPYATPDNCGQAIYHDLEGSKQLAQTLLDNKNQWRQVL